jgi:hypothetical protein
MGYWDLVEPYWEKVNIYDGPDEFLRTLAAVPSTVQTLIAAHWCESEVSNGGLYQFFSNPTGVLAPEAAEAYRVLRVPELANVIDEAMGFFGEDYPRDRDVRDAALPRTEGRPREQWDPFSELDERFYEAAGYRGGQFEKDRLFLAMDEYAVRRPPQSGRRTTR